MWGGRKSGGLMIRFMVVVMNERMVVLFNVMGNIREDIGLERGKRMISLVFSNNVILFLVFFKLDICIFSFCKF